MANQTDMQAMMDVYEKLGTPAEQHKMLASMAGSYDATIKNWTVQGEPPMESRGSSELRMILGGRFLQEEHSSEMMGSMYNGMGITGYDNHTKKFVSTWIDSMSTSIMCFEGSASPDNTSFTMECSYDDAVRGPMKWRSVTTIVNANVHNFEMFSIDQNGKQEKSMEITYTRKG
ncbi:MAG: DUF1579 domain-containing protein [Chitinivibrionales bacterium]